jgi:hypothetical protein
MATIVAECVPIDAQATPKTDDTKTVSHRLTRASNKSTHQKNNLVPVTHKPFRERLINHFRSAGKRVLTILPCHPDDLHN